MSVQTLTERIRNLQKQRNNLDMKINKATTEARVKKRKDETRLKIILGSLVVDRLRQKQKNLDFYSMYGDISDRDLDFMRALDQHDDTYAFLGTVSANELAKRRARAGSETANAVQDIDTNTEFDELSA